ncbi:MAG TPA: hypothetical protein VG796_00700 [Verrucomicrobiales bacterium]|jgi:hypothetical protein|nr:hypothetical protein [Verrucomicrobiales bacterium]
MKAIEPSAEETMAIRRATGLPVLEAKEFIRSSSPELIQRILDAHSARRAVATQEAREALHDPIEDDAVAGAVVRRVLAEVERDVKAECGTLRMQGHLIWNNARKRLLKEHGIVWYSPAQMNPGDVFD